MHEIPTRYAASDVPLTPASGAIAIVAGSDQAPTIHGGADVVPDGERYSHKCG